MSRATVRAALGTAMAGRGFTTIYTYAPLDLKGATKVLAIYAKSSRPDIISSGITNHFHDFFLDVYVKRESGINTEDSLDPLHDAIVAMVKENPATANWSHLELQESTALFAQVASVPYRVERHPLRVKVTE